MITSIIFKLLILYPFIDIISSKAPVCELAPDG
jgi:hypothetical protein